MNRNHHLALVVVLLLGLLLSVPILTTQAAAGDLDTTFDFDGKVITCCGPDAGHSVAIQADGKIVTAGITRNLQTFKYQIWLVRYNPDGSLDASFGAGGEVRTNTVTNGDNGIGNRAPIAIQADGKIVVSNWAADVDGTGGFDYGTFVYRYNPDGSLDSTFGNGGIANFKGPNSVFTNVYMVMSLVIQTDQKILLGVRHHEDVVNSPIVAAFGVLRLNSDGSRDSTFGNSGFVFTPSLLGNAQSGDIPTAIAVHTDGKIVMVGLAARSAGGFMFGVVRYNSNGSLDTSFDGDGIVTTQIGDPGFGGDEPYSVGIQSDGKIVVAGIHREGFTAVVRYNPDGSLDTSFDGDGIVLTAGGGSVAERLVIQPNNKIVVAATNNIDFLIARYLADGSLDSSWGIGGIVTTDFGTDSEPANSIVSQADGKVVVVGRSSNRLAISRYLADEAAPTPSPTPTPTPTPTPLPTPTPNTEPGANVTVQSQAGDARVTFPQVISAGETTFTPIDPPSSAGTPPAGYTILGAGPAYDITTTATLTPPVTVCFTVSSISDPTEFSRVRILHGESGQLVDRTILPPDSRAPDFAARTVCARVNSLSPFVVALAPAATPTPTPVAVVPTNGVPPTLTPIVVNNGAGDQTDPHVSGDWAAYTSDVSIRYYNFATNTDAAVPMGSSARDLLSDVSGGKIVFSRVITGVKTAVMVFDANTPAAAPIELDPAPASNRLGSAIGGNTVAYVDFGLHPNGEVVIHDLATSTSLRVTNDASFDQNPSVSPDGNVVAWERCASFANCDIWQAVKVGPGWTAAAVVDSATPEGNPDANGSLVVYDARRGTDFGDIFWYTVGGGVETQLQMPSVETNPSIAGNFLAFESRPNLFATTDLFVYDISANRLYQITNTALVTEQLNDITLLPDGRLRVVWASDEDGFDQRNIRAATFTLPGGDNTPPVIDPISDVVVTLPPNSTATSMPVTFPTPTASDDSGTATVTTSPASGTVFPVGATTVVVTAADNAGNIATSNFSVTVLHNFSGFLAPVDGLPVLNVTNAGQAIPVKFSLSGNKGLNILAAGYPISGQIACDANEPGTVVEETVAAGGSSLSYDAAADRYTYVWKTQKTWKGTCRILALRLNDGSEHFAKFRFK